MVIEISTLVDITRTGVTRPQQGSQLEIDQHRNFITLTQCAELRSIVNYTNPPVFRIIDIKGIGFGTDFKGKQKVWTFQLESDRSGVYTDTDGNTIGLLIEDMHAVPIVKNLTESINIDVAIFDLKNVKTRNTIIKAL